METKKVIFFALFNSGAMLHDRIAVINAEDEESLMQTFFDWIKDKRSEIERLQNSNVLVNDCKIIR